MNVVEFKKKYYINSKNDLNLILSEDNEAELGACIYLINKLVLDAEHYILHGEDATQIMNEFDTEYKNIINNYIDLYIMCFSNDLYGDNLSTSDKIKISNEIKSKYPISDYNLKEITIILNKEVNKIFKETINVERYVSLVKEVEDKLNNIEKNFSKHPMYKEMIVDVITFRNSSVNNLNDLLELYKEKTTKEIRDAILHEVNSLCVCIENLLDSELKLKNAKETCLRYLKKLVRHGYVEDDDQPIFIDKINNAKNMSVVNKIRKDLYLNYYYPQKVEFIKKNLNKKVNFWIRNNKGREQEFLMLRDRLFDKLDTGMNSLKERDLIMMDSMGITNAYDMIDKYSQSR